MPRKRNQKIYRLSGGKFYGKGGFGCVHDLLDITKLIDVGILTTKNCGTFENAITKSNSNSNVVTDNITFDNINDHVIKLFVDEKAYIDEKKRVIELFKQFKKETNAYKRFINKNASSNVSNNASRKVSKKIGFHDIFPSFHVYGELVVNSQTLISADIKGIDFVKDLLKDCRFGLSETSKLYFVTMDKLSNSLEDLLKQSDIETIIPYNDFIISAAKLIKKLDLLHNLGYIHGDIKPLNILYKGKELYFGDIGGIIHINELIEKGKNVYTQGYTFPMKGRSSMTSIPNSANTKPEDTDTEQQNALISKISCNYEFCKSIGLKNGNMVKQYVNGYFNDLYQHIMEMKTNVNKPFFSTKSSNVSLFYKNFEFADKLPLGITLGLIMQKYHQSKSLKKETLTDTKTIEEQLNVLESEYDIDIFVRDSNMPLLNNMIYHVCQDINIPRANSNTNTSFSSPIVCDIKPQEENSSVREHLAKVWGVVM